MAQKPSTDTSERWQQFQELKAILDDPTKHESELVEGRRGWQLAKWCGLLELHRRIPINIPGVSPELLRDVVEYLYSGKSQPSSVKHAMDLAWAAHTMQCELLQAICERYLERTISLTCVCELLVLADKLYPTMLTPLKRACVLYINRCSSLIEPEQMQTVHELYSTLQPLVGGRSTRIFSASSPADGAARCSSTSSSSSATSTVLSAASSATASTTHDAATTCAPTSTATAAISTTTTAATTATTTTPRGGDTTATCAQQQPLSALAMQALRADFESALTQQLYCDFSFVVEDVRYPAHRVILCSRSVRFKAMLSSSFKESEQIEVPVSYVKPAVFQKVLEFLYSWTVDVDPDMISELLAASTNYMLPRLGLLCCALLEHGVDVDNVCCILELAQQHDAQKLTHICLEFMRSNFPAVLKTAGWGALQEKYRHRVMSSISNPAACIVKGRGRNHCIVQRASTFHIHAVDYHGNPRRSGEEMFSVTILSPNGHSGINVKVHDRKDGTYKVVYSVSRPGTYVLSVSLFDIQVSGSPFMITAVPNQERVVGVDTACDAVFPNTRSTRTPAQPPPPKGLFNLAMPELQATLNYKGSTSAYRGKMHFEFGAPQENTQAANTTTTGKRSTFFTSLPAFIMERGINMPRAVEPASDFWASLEKAHLTNDDAPTSDPPVNYLGPDSHFNDPDDAEDTAPRGMRGKGTGAVSPDNADGDAAVEAEFEVSSAAAPTSAPSRTEAPKTTAAKPLPTDTDNNEMSFRDALRGSQPPAAAPPKPACPPLAANTNASLAEMYGLDTPDDKHTKPRGRPTFTARRGDRSARQPRSTPSSTPADCSSPSTLRTPSSGGPNASPSPDNHTTPPGSASLFSAGASSSPAPPTPSLFSGKSSTSTPLGSASLFSGSATPSPNGAKSFSFTGGAATTPTALGGASMFSGGATPSPKPFSFSGGAATTPTALGGASLFSGGAATTPTALGGASMFSGSAATTPTALGGASLFSGGATPSPKPFNFSGSALASTPKQ